MKNKISILILLVAFGVSASARVVIPWPDARMREASDLIVIGTISQVRDLDETNSILWPGCNLRGVETTFKVFEVLNKGSLTNYTIILHHYRFNDVIPPNCPNLVDLSPADTNRYLLYLIKDGTARYAPVSGQLDPAVDAVKIADTGGIISALGGIKVALHDWPEYVNDISGSNKLVVKNPNLYEVKVGLRSNGNGRDFTVAAKSSASVSVPDGRYDIYVQHSNEPMANESETHPIFQEDSFALKGHDAEIEVTEILWH